MSKDEFTKLFQYMMRIEGKLDMQSENMATKDDIRQITNRLYAIEKHIDMSDTERLAMDRHLDRVDRWTHELADKIGHKLKV